MKAISLKPPWAWLMTTGIKKVENRRWSSNYRGPILIHASKTWDQEGYEFILRIATIYEISILPDKDEHVRGAIIGRANMVDCVKSHPSKWFFGPYGFVWEDAFPLISPIPYRGQLGIFNVKDL